MTSKLYVSLLVAMGYAQCCSPNPVAGTSSIGTLSRGTLRVIGIYRHSYFKGSMLKDKKVPVRYLNRAGYDLASLILSLGVTSSLTVDFETGYYIRNYEEFNLEPPLFVSGHGLTDGILTVKYAVLQRSQVELTLGVGGSLPLSKPLYVNQARLNASIQPSSFAAGARGVLFVRYEVLENLRTFLIHQSLFWGTNDVGYQKGASHITSLFLTRNLSTHWFASLVIRSDYRQRHRYSGTVAPASGGFGIYVSPQITFSPGKPKQFYVSLLLDYPAYQYYRGIQIRHQYGLNVILTKDWGLF
ncbi:MAG: hypothetical protein ACUVRD_06910 [Bacteroidia bacterium]